MKALTLRRVKFSSVWVRCSQQAAETGVRTEKKQIKLASIAVLVSKLGLNALERNPCKFVAKNIT